MVKLSMVEGTDLVWRFFQMMSTSTEILNKICLRELDFISGISLNIF